MKIYDAPAANPKRVRIFIVEKGIEIDREPVELGEGTRSKAFLSINSLRELPALETDEGLVITESQAICRYLDECYPNTPLWGETTLERARIDMWARRIHNQIFMTYGQYVRHTIPLFAEVENQNADFASSMKARIPSKWRWLESELKANQQFIVEDRFSMADIEGMTALFLADALDLQPPEDCHRVHAWAERMRARPSFSA